MTTDPNVHTWWIIRPRSVRAILTGNDGDIGLGSMRAIGRVSSFDSMGTISRGSGWGGDGSMIGITGDDEGLAMVTI